MVEEVDRDRNKRDEVEGGWSERDNWTVVVESLG